MYLVKFESNIDYGMIIFSKGTNAKVHSHQTQHATKFPPLTSTLGFQIHINRARVMIKVSPMTDSPIREYKSRFSTRESRTVNIPP